MTISDHSLQLSNILKRSNMQGDANHFNQVFTYTMQQWGRRELDFNRDLEVSFNPLPARIPQILLTIGNCNRYSVLSASQLILLLELSNEIDCSIFSSEEHLLAENSKKAVEQFKANDSDAVNLGLAFWLDRARHFHLSDKSKDKNQCMQFVNKIIECRELAVKYAVDYVAYFNLLLTRFKKKYLI